MTHWIHASLTRTAAPTSMLSVSSSGKLHIAVSLQVGCCVSKLDKLPSVEDQGHTNRITANGTSCLEDLERSCGKGRSSQARKLNREDAVDHSRWRKLVKDV